MKQITTRPRGWAPTKTNEKVLSMDVPWYLMGTQYMPASCLWVTMVTLSSNNTGLWSGGLALWRLRQKGAGLSFRRAPY